MTWCRRDANEIVVEVIDFDPTGKFHPDLVWYDCPDGTQQGDFWNGTDYVPPTAVPPPDGETSRDALNVADQGIAWYNQNEDRKRVGATPIIDAADQAAWDTWMKDTYDAVDAGVEPPEPPSTFRRAVDMPGQEEGQCVISWYEFGGGWPGWGFKAIFKRQDITALGLKVYDENSAYLYALTFEEGNYPGEWITETPAGFATPTKVARSFEIIAGSAPVSEFLTLTDAVDFISFIVKWQPGDPV